MEFSTRDIIEMTQIIDGRMAVRGSKKLFLEASKKAKAQGYKQTDMVRNLLLWFVLEDIDLSELPGATNGCIACKKAQE